MSEVRDEQAGAEVLDADRIDLANYPPEESMGTEALLDKDVPAAGEYAPDSLVERIAREEPDFGARVLHEGARGAPGLIEPDDPFGDDLTDIMIAEEAEAADDLDPAVLSDSEVSPYESTLSAEEAAIHLVGDEDEI